jgi:outer membrane protein assembly factor BamE (lipoprotein component of BamABCDE complex)
MRILLISFLLAVTGCSTSKENNINSIILTSGYAMDPDAPRIGIEITPDTIFYTEGHSSAPTAFKYYYCLTNQAEFEKVKNIAEKYLTNLENDEDIADVTNYQINIGNKKTRFNSASVTKESHAALEYILNLKNCRLKKMGHHVFPTEILQEQLPPPPPLPIVSEKEK